MAKDNKPLRLEEIEKKLYNEQGENLFSEAKNEVFEAEEAFSEGTSYQASGYETTLSNHAFLVLVLALAGLVVYVVCGVVAYNNVEDRTVFLMAQPFFTLIASIPAWLLGRTDLKAIKVGAMDGSGSLVLKIGTIIGATVSLLVFCQLIYYLLNFVFDIFGINLFPRF